MLMDWLKKAPTSIVVSVIATVGILTLTTLIGFFLLIYAGKDVTEFRSLINTVLNTVTLGLSGLGAVAAVGAAKSSSKAEDQTNGLLTERDQLIKRQAVVIDAHEQRLRSMGLTPFDNDGGNHG